LRITLKNITLKNVTGLAQISAMCADAREDEKAVRLKTEKLDEYNLGTYLYGNRYKGPVVNRYDNCMPFLRKEHGMVLLGLFMILVAFAIIETGILYPNGLSANRQRSISITSTGSASAYPDLGVIDVLVNGTGYSMQSAVANLSSGISALNATMLRYLSGNSSGISTISYSVYSVRNSSLYDASEYLKITLPNSQNISAALESLSALKRTYVLSATAELSPAQQEQLRKEALGYALANATSQAEALSGNATLEVQNITAISSIYYEPYPIYAAAEYSTSYGTGQQLFYIGNSSVNVRINAVFTYN
jgi:uncharacterized protein YggE